MSLILKQETAGSISTPPSGKGTLFIDTTGNLAVKQPSGTTSTVPAISTSNTQVMFNDDGAIGGTSTLVFDKTSGVLTAGNLTVSGSTTLGAVANVHISGGSSGYVLTTDGAANLSWAAASSPYGNSNVATFLSTFGSNTITTTGSVSVGSLAVSGGTNLGPVGNVTITGGTSGYVLSTNGSGTLSWVAPPSSSSIANGSSNVSISIAGGNIELNSGGSTVANISNTGMILYGSLTSLGIITSTGNVTGANLTTGGLITATGNITGGNVIATNLVTGTEVSSSGNAYLGNVISGGYAMITGNVTAGNLITSGSGGNITGANVISATTLSATTLSASGYANIGSYISIDGTSSNISGVGKIEAFALDISGGGTTTQWLSVSGTSNLGAVGNITITGGSSGQVLSTNGSGVLSWATAGGGGSANLEAVDTDILPLFDAVYDIGSTTKQWYDLYLTANLNINGAKLTGVDSTFTSSSDVVFAGATLLDLLLFTDNMVTPDPSTAIQYFGDKGVMVVNGDLDIQGDWMASPVVETIPGEAGANAGTLISTFTATANVTPTLSRNYSSSVVQNDGKIVVAYWTGASTSVVRLGTDGSLDSSFTEIVFDGAVNSMILDVSGSNVVIGGSFTHYQGTSGYWAANYIIKVTSTGALQPDFYNGTGIGFNGAVKALALTSTGSIIVGGDFTTYQGTTCNFLCKLANTAQFDSTFTSNVGTGPDSTVYSLATNGGTGVLVGGGWNYFNGNPYSKLVWITESGTSLTYPMTIYDGVVTAIAVNTDGSFIATGSFSSGAGTGFHPSLVKVSKAGAADATFGSSITTGTLGQAPYAIAAMGDGKIVLGGSFPYWNSFSGNVNSIIVLNDDGSLYSGFPIGSPSSGIGFGSNSYVYTIQKISSTVAFVAGSFTTWNGTSVKSAMEIYTSLQASAADTTPPTSGRAGFLRYNNDITAFQGYNGSSWELLERCTTPPTSLETTGTIDIDFSGALLQTQGALTGNITYTGNNYASGSSVTIRVVGGAIEQTVSFPSGWVFVGTAPTALAAGATAILTVTSFGTTAADCVAAWAVSA